MKCPRNLCPIFSPGEGRDQIIRGRAPEARILIGHCLGMQDILAPDVSDSKTESGNGLSEIDIRKRF